MTSLTDLASPLKTTRAPLFFPSAIREANCRTSGDAEMSPLAATAFFLCDAISWMLSQRSFLCALRAVSSKVAPLSLSFRSLLWPGGLISSGID